MNETMEITRGDIVYVPTDFKDEQGFVQTRPAVVLSNDENNRYSGVVNVVYLKRGMPNRNYPMHVRMDDKIEFYKPEPRGMSDSWVLCESIASLNKDAICKGGAVGHVYDGKMYEVSMAVAEQLGLKEIALNLTEC